MKPKILAVEDAVQLIHDNATVCIGGGGAGHAVPDSLLAALGRRFLHSGSPRDLTVIHPCGIGDGDRRGLNHIAHAGLIRRVVGGFWGNAPLMANLARENRIEAYNLPQGVLSHLMRACAAGQPGVITTTGLHTFVDPRLEGGRLNESSREELVRLIFLEDSDFLFYPAPRLDVGLIRGTSVDTEGNLSMEEEVGTFAMLSIAQAVRRNRGTVIAQVKRVRADQNTDPKQVKVPGAFIDAVVVEPEQQMTFLTGHDPALIKRDAPPPALSSNLNGIHRVIAKRAAMELFPGAFVNLGYGMPDGVPIVAKEEGVVDQVVFMIEQGALGGIPTTGLNFGAMFRPTAIVDDSYQFDYFHGGGLDIAFLGFAQVDRLGNVNSSRFGSQITGCGGFIDISQHARKVVFCGSFAVKAESAVDGGRLRILHGGKYRKFVAGVEQLTFNGPYSIEKGQQILYVTERAVFELTPAGLRLIEVAPGIDLERDVLQMMDFRPAVSVNVRQMSPALFSDEPIDLQTRFGSPRKEAAKGPNGQ